VKLKAALEQGKTINVKVNSDGEAIVNFRNGKNKTGFSTNLTAFADKKIAGLSMRIGNTPDGRLKMMVTGGVKFGKVEFSASAFVNIDLSQAVLSNSGLLGQAARALRDRPEVIERAIRRDGG